MKNLHYNDIVNMTSNFFDDCCIWLKDCLALGMKSEVPSKVVLHCLLPTII